jgi:hypothetical protein
VFGQEFKGERQYRLFTTKSLNFKTENILNFAQPSLE